MSKSKAKPLLDTTRGLLERKLDKGATVVDIAKGAGVPRGWVSLLIHEPHRDPGVKKVQQLHDWLAKNA